MSREALWATVRAAWGKLSGRRGRRVLAGRPREEPNRPAVAPAIAADGFVEEALPWLDAVYRFSLRLTRGDRDAAEDLAQETFMRAHRFWHTFVRGTNAKSWLFTICRNTHIHREERVRNRRERPASDLDADVEALAARSPLVHPSTDPEQEFFELMIDDEVVEAIDDLPEEFHDVLVLSDLGDLRYAEIAEVLDIPVGTVKSRLFRGRRLLQKRLRDFAVQSGYVEETT